MTAIRTQPQHPPGRGRLVVLLGSGPWCPTTRRLRDEGLRLAANGRDVVSAWGRLGPGGPETVPPRITGALGLSVEEMDVDAVLRRRPDVCLVDGVAHACAPGGRRQRRHEDVEDLLAAGISVVTTLDVAAVESLGGVVRAAVGAEPRDVVPDAFLRRADEVVCVDADPGDAGADAPSVALRELALREVAEWLSRRSSRGPAPLAAERGGRVLACVASESPRAEELVRRASAIAGRLNTNWFVVHVARPQAHQTADSQRALARAAALAEELGAEFVALAGSDPVAATVDFARSHGVTHVVVGRSGRSSLWRMLTGSFVGRLLSDAHDLDVHVIAAADGGPA